MGWVDYEVIFDSFQESRQEIEERYIFIERV